jgi:hypothetical protein
MRLNVDCDSAFAGSRLCSSGDISQSSPLTPLPTTDAWVRPIFVGGTSSNGVVLVDAYARQAIVGTNDFCLRTTPTGFLDHGSCNVMILPAACCR